MFTGGQLLGTFAGPGGQGQVIELENSVKTGKYVLVQMNARDCLHLREVEVYGPVETRKECKDSLELEVANGDFTNDEGLVENLFNPDKTEWRAVESTTKGQGFVMKFQAGEQNTTGIKLKNAAQPWAAEKFKVTGSLKKNGPWISLVDGKLEVSSDEQIFNFGRTRLLRFFKFELLSYARQRGGGLQFFSILKGE